MLFATAISDLIFETRNNVALLWLLGLAVACLTRPLERLRASWSGRKNCSEQR
jgi:hypothetical protein